MSTEFKIPDKLPEHLFSKENPWYKKDSTGLIRDSSRKLLEEYSHIAPEDVDAHIYRMRDILWDNAPYPCIGSFKFLDLNLPSHPLYPTLLPKLQAATPSGPFHLDLGCCVAQELRVLVSAGVPSENIYGSDINPHFLNTSYELFNDKETFKGTLIPADITSEKLFEEEFKGWEGKFESISAGLFIHLFSRDQQLIVFSRIMKMMKPEKGSVFFGEAAGNLGGGECDSGSDKSKFGKQFLHDVDSFREVWGEVAVKEGSAVQWKVGGSFKLATKEKEGKTFFKGPGVGWLVFWAERL